MCIPSIVKLIVVFAVTFLLVFVVSYVFARFEIHPFAWLLKSRSPETKIMSSLLDRLHSVRELHSALSSCQVIVTTKQEKTLLGLGVGETRLLYVAVGVIRAGVDLSKMDENSITVNDGTVLVALPAAEILDSKIDVEKSFVYDVRRSTLAPNGFDLQSEAEKQALSEVEAAAIRCGVLQLAQEQAALTLKSLLEMVGYSVVDVRVVSAEDGGAGDGG